MGSDFSMNPPTPTEGERLITAEAAIRRDIALSAYELGHLTIALNKYFEDGGGIRMINPPQGELLYERGDLMYRLTLQVEH